MAKAGKRRPSGRTLRKFDQDRRDERERLDFTDYAPDPSLEDEYYGGFDSREPDHDDGLIWRDGPFRGRKDRAPTWGHVWGRTDIDRGRFARQVAPKRWADDGLWGLVDGQTPGTHDWLKERGRWPKWRKITRQRATSNQVSFPFALQKIALAEQRLPEVDPERDAAEDLDRRARRLEALADQGITDPNDRPFAPHNVLHAERLQFYAQHTERRVQALLYRGYKPSRKLELRRFGALKRVASNPLLTKDYLGRGLRSIKDAREAECELLVAQFLAEGGKVRLCEPEKTAAQIKKAAPKIGRPPIGKEAMSDLERKRRSRPLSERKPGRKPLGAIAMTPAERRRKHYRTKQLRALSAPERRQAGAGQPLPRGRPAPVNLLRKDEKA